MQSLNQVMLIGYVGKDPEVLKTTEKGLFARFSLATTKKYTDVKGSVCEDTQWHTVYVNHNLGKVVSDHLKKGARIYVSGELRSSAWKDKDDETHYTTAVYAKELLFLSKKLSETSDEKSDRSDSDEESTFAS